MYIAWDSSDISLPDSSLQQLVIITEHPPSHDELNYSENTR